MSGIFSVLSDGQSGMFRLQQAKKAWERDMEAMDAKDAKQRLADKADAVRQPFALTPQQQRDRTAAISAMEEAKRVGGPKAAAEQKLEEVERKIAELKLMMRYSHGNREKLAQLAREAAILAREAGRAAKQYGEGVAAAAEMGLPGASAGGSGTEILHTTTRTSLTVVQTEVSVDLTVTISPDALAKAQGAAPGGTAQAGMDAGEAALSQAASSGPSHDDPSAGETDAVEAEAADLEDQAMQAGVGASAETANALPPDLAEAVRAALGGLQPGSGPMSSAQGRALMQRMIADNELKMSRYKEADAFGRRVEDVLNTVKSVIGEAKVANETDQSQERRKARKESFKAYDKIVEGAQDEVNGLRQAAFGSSITPEEALNLLAGETSQDAAPPSANAVGEVAGAGADSSAGGTLPAINLLA